MKRFQKILILISGFCDSGDQEKYALVTLLPFLGIITCPGSSLQGSNSIF